MQLVTKGPFQEALRGRKVVAGRLGINDPLFLKGDLIRVDIKPSALQSLGLCPRRGVSRMKRKDSSFQCCIKDEGRPFTYATQLEYVNHLKVLYSKGTVLNV